MRFRGDICGLRVCIGALACVALGFAGAATAGALGLVITGGPSGTITSSSATFTFQTKYPATFRCSLNGGTPTDCGTGTTTGTTGTAPYPDLPNGTYDFLVVAASGIPARTDAVGVVDRQSRSFTVAVPPDTKITSGPPASTSSRDALFAFESVPADATFECSRDGQTFVACTSPQPYSALGLRSHSFEVRAVSPIGTDPTPARATWTIVAPLPQLDTRITSTPNPSTTSTSATFSFASAPAGAGFECSLDGRPFLGCASPKTYPALRRTRHKFEVRARTAAAVDTTPATFTWSIGVPVPDTVITRPPRSSKSRNALIAFRSIPSGAGFQCSLNGLPFRPCASPTRLTRLRTGNHRFSVRAHNEAGIDASPATVTWRTTASQPWIPAAAGGAGGALLLVGGLGFALQRRRFRLRMQLQASDEEPTGRCEGRGWRCHKELTLKPGRREIAHVKATAGRSVHELDDGIVSKLNDAVGAYRHSRDPAEEMRLVLLPIAGEILQDLDERLARERSGADGGDASQIELAAHLEGGKAECVLTPYRCTKGNWRKRRPWKVEVADERDEPIATVLHPGTTVALLVGHLAAFVANVDIAESRVPEAAAVPHG